MTLLSSAIIPPPASADPSLKSAVASTVFDLDATKAASYPGTGQTWANLVASPADGAAQTDYDFYVGATGSATTDDPTFNGTAGNAAAYWSFDGGDQFVLKSGANTGFLKSLHKTTGGADFWIAFTMYLPNSDAQIVCGTGHTSTALQRSIQLTANAGANNNFAFGQRGDTSAATINTTNNLYADDTPTVFLFSHSHATNKSKYWIATTTGVEVTHTFNATTTDPLAPFTISGRANVQTNFIANGGRLYSFAMGNEYLDDAKAAAIIAALNTRHGRTYA